jgi:hypothetical protein
MTAGPDFNGPSRWALSHSAMGAGEDDQFSCRQSRCLKAVTANATVPPAAQGNRAASGGVLDGAGTRATLVDVAMPGGSRIALPAPGSARRGHSVVVGGPAADGRHDALRQDRRKGNSEGNFCGNPAPSSNSSGEVSAPNLLVRSAPRGIRTPNRQIRRLPPIVRLLVCGPSVLLTSQNLVLPVRPVSCGPSVGLSSSVKNSVNAPVSPDVNGRVESGASPAECGLASGDRRCRQAVCSAWPPSATVLL